MTGIALSDGTSGAAPAAQPAPVTTPAVTPVAATAPVVAADGSPGSPPAATPAPATGSTPWHASITDAGLKTLAEKKGWTTPEAALKSYAELETAFGAKQAANQAPAAAADYKFSETKLPDGMPYDTKFAGKFADMAHKAGLSQAQADAIHKAYVDYAAENFTTHTAASVQQLSERVGKVATDLETAFGAKQGTPVFNRQVDMAKRAIRNLGPDVSAALKEAGAIVTVNGQEMVGNAALFAAFAKAGNGMFAEDSMFGAPAADVNPFAEKTEDMAKQAWYVKNDPEKAKLLIRASDSPRIRSMYAQFLSR